MRKILFFIPLFLWTCGGGGSSPTEPELPQLPTVQNINLTGIEDTPKVFTFVGTDPLNLALSFSISSQPQHGTVVISGGSGTYTPDTNYNGQDTFLYLASTVNGNSNIGTVVIDIVPVDDEPNTMDVSVTTDEDNVVTMTLEAEEVDGQTIQFNVTGDPSNGSVTISGTTATYTPNQNWFGTDTFNFEATDVTSKSILNNATGTITVNPINDAPTVDDIDDINAVLNQTTDITLIGNDVENDNLTFSIETSPSNGTISVQGNIATYIGQSIGSDSFTYKANDGTDDSNISTVSIETYSPNFETTFGGNNSDTSHSIENTPDGGFIIAGRSSSFADSNGDAYVIRTDELGNEVWSSSIGSVTTHSERLYSVKNTSDGGFIFAGSTNDLTAGNTDGYLVKTDSNGNVEWSKQFDDGDESTTGTSDGVQDFNSVINTLDGGYLMVGGTSVQDAQRIDMYLIKIDSSGNKEWEKIIGTSGVNERLYDAIALSDGDYIILGQDNSRGYLSKINSSGEEQWTQIYTLSGNLGLKGIDETSDGGYILCGIDHSSDSGDVYAMKTDGSGNEEWSKSIGGSGFENSDAAYETSDGGFIIAGRTQSSGAGSTDIFLVKLDSSGNEVWSKTYGGEQVDVAYDMKITSEGGYVLTGYTQSFGNGSNDVYMIKTNENGNRIF